LDTKSVVRDLDTVRAAVGEQELSLYGLSYGTLLGQQYAQRFPQHVRALVLDSVMDHSLATAWDFLRGETQAVQETFEQFAAWCQRSTDCALHGRDLRKVFADLMARAERGELTKRTSSGEVEKVQPLSLLGNVEGNLHDPDHTWKYLSHYLTDLAAGTSTDAGQASQKPSTQRMPKPAYGDETVADLTGVICADWRLPVRNAAEVQDLRRRLASVAPDIKMSVQAWGATVQCIGWPGGVRNPQEPVRWAGMPPALLLNSRYDPATSYEWAQSVERQTGAVLLTYDGWGHGVMSAGSACATAAAVKYLLEVQTPARGTHCPAVQPRTS
jgi:pimeloyl-ACP methyl ester carboxylesterase